MTSMWSKVIKWSLYILPLVAIAFLLNSGPVLKRPMGAEDDVAGGLHRLEQAALGSDWGQAESAWEQTHDAFVKVERRVEVVVERDELQDFYMELARLRGAIQAGDRSEVLAQVALLKALFDEFGD